MEESPGRGRTPRIPPADEIGSIVYHPEDDRPDDVMVIVPDDTTYPRRLADCLGGDAPRTLHCVGNASLLNSGRVVMVCGSRSASPEGLDLAFRTSRLIAEQGIVVASGYARGIDMAAHRGALHGGGDTIAILPYGVSRFRLSGDLDGIFKREHFAAASELPPWCPFTVQGALRRNVLLTACAAAVIVIEPGDTGGTWHSVKAARDLGRPLFFIEGSRSDFINRLERKGGSRIAVTNGVPNLQPVLDRL
jgi:DNA processing protein